MSNPATVCKKPVLADLSTAIQAADSLEVKGLRPTELTAGPTGRGTVTIEVNPGDPNALPPSSGPVQFTFEVVPQTDLRSFRTTVRSDHPWLTMMTTATTAVTPANTPPTQISTQGDFNSPRGCRGTFGSVGIAEATRIDADFTGTDCQQAAFVRRVVLTKI